MRSRAPLIGGITLALLAAAPAAATAATASLDGSTLSVVAGQGEANQLNISISGTELVVTESGDGVALTAAGPGCTGAGNVVRCPTAAVDSIDVAAGDLDDTVFLTSGVVLPATLAGGAGNDLLIGGSGDDTIDGGASDDFLGGQLGDDSFSGGAGQDSVGYDLRSEPVTARIGGDQEGQAGERDRIATDVEGLRGGSGNDVLTAGPGPSKLQGLAGDDTLHSRNGAADELLCGDGADSAIAEPVDSIGADCESVDTDIPPPASKPPASAPPETEPAAGDDPGAPSGDPEPSLARLARALISQRPITLTRNGVAPVRVHCPKDHARRCKGTVTIRLAGRRKQRRLARSARRSRKRERPSSRAVIGRRRFSIPAGRTVAVRVRISRNGRRRIVRSRRKRCRISVTMPVRDGERITTTRTIILKAPMKERRR